GRGPRFRDSWLSAVGSTHRRRGLSARRFHPQRASDRSSPEYRPGGPFHGPLVGRREYANTHAVDVSAIFSRANRERKIVAAESAVLDRRWSQRAGNQLKSLRQCEISLWCQPRSTDTGGNNPELRRTPSLTRFDGNGFVRLPVGDP